MGISVSREMQTIEDILDEYIRPKLREHGGNVEIDAVRKETLYVKLRGHCSGCPSAKYTLENLIKEEVLKHTHLVKDVKLSEEVSQELYDFAKRILTEGRGSAYADRN